MKCFVLILILSALFFIPQLHAQHFAAGLSAGPVVSDVQGTDTRDYDNDFNKVGISVGAFVNRKFGEKNIIQLELNYVQKGTEQLPDSNNNGYFKLVLNYVEVPLLIRHSIHFNSYRKAYNNFEWELGVSGGYLSSAKYIDNGYNLPLDPDNYNKIDVSILGGINYKFSSGFYLSIRYSNSVIPVIKHSALPAEALTAYPLSFNDGNNLVYQFCFKYVFGDTRDR